MKIDWEVLPFAILCFVPILVVCGIGFEKYFKSQEMIACYEAAKVNTNLVCEKK